MWLPTGTHTVKALAFGNPANPGMTDFQPIFVNPDPGINYRIITVLCNHQDYSAM